MAKNKFCFCRASDVGCEIWMRSSQTAATVFNAQSKSERDKRGAVAIARREIRRVVQGNFGSTRSRTGFARFGQATSIRSGMEPRASREIQLSVPRALSAMGALFGHFR